MFGLGKKNKRLEELREFYAGHNVSISSKTGMPELLNEFYWNVSELRPPLNMSAGGGYRTVTLYTPEGAKLSSVEFYIPSRAVGDYKERTLISDVASGIMREHIIEPEVLVDPLAGNYPPNKL